MILSPYRNPPYRSPTPRGQSSPQTPKRKREEAPDLDDRPPELENQAQVDDVNDTRANSPRTKVANRLKELDIRHAGPTFPANEADAQRKRIKRRSGGYDSPLQGGSPTSAIQSSQESRAQKREPTSAEVKETPDCRTTQPRSPSLSPPPSPTYPIAYVEITPPKRTFTYRNPIEPDLFSFPSNLLVPPTEEEASIERSASPLPSKGDLTPDQAALTWQDHEITGHEIDPGGDDDGEGINGIGFRPTAAIAAARQQRRKQQVNEWKAREAREARQKRFEQRRVTGGGGGGGGSSDAVQKEAFMSSPTTARMVRFVGAG